MDTKPTTEQENIKKFLTILKKIDPELYMVKLTLLAYKEVPPLILPPYIEAIGKILIGTGYGSAVTNVEAKEIKTTRSEQSFRINIKAYMGNEKIPLEFTPKPK